MERNRIIPSSLDIRSIQKDYAKAVLPCCDDQQCKLILNNLQGYVILKGDTALTNCKMCDCIVFKVNGLITIGIIELKSKTVHASEVKEKLVNGTKFASSILQKYRVNHLAHKYYPILLHKGLDPISIRMIYKKRISVAGKKLPIYVKRCGTYFSSIIEETI